MPSAQNGDAKAGAQLNPYNGGDQRKKNTNGGNANSNKSISNSNNNSHYSQQSKQSNRRMGQPTIGGATSSSDHYHHRTGSSGVSSVPQPTPLFERLVTEEVQELKAYARIIENQNRRLVELERIHGDLENRLELEARERTQLEADLEQRERGWSMKYHKLEKDRDQWKEFVSQEQAKNTRLIDQVVRKDKDIHRMLQRKVSQQSPCQTTTNDTHLQRFVRIKHCHM